MTLLLVVTVPALALGFLGITLGAATLLKGRSTTLTSVRLLTTADGLPCAREIGVTALFSPSTRAYAVAPPPGRVPLPRRHAGPSRGTDAAPLEVEEAGGETRIRAVAVGQWQSWALETHALVDLGRGVRWSRRGGVLRVENGSALDIERAVLVRTGRTGTTTPIGAVAPGAAAEAPAAVPRWAPSEDLGFGPESLGGRAVGECLHDLRLESRAEVGPDGRTTARSEELLVCVVRDAGPGVEVDARRSGDSRSLTILVVREARP